MITHILFAKLMDKIKSNNKGCSIFIGLIIFLVVFGIIKSIFFPDEEKPRENILIDKQSVLTLGQLSNLDTALIIKSIFKIHNNDELKKTINNTKFRFEEVAAYRISIPNGLENSIVIVSLGKNQSFNIENSIDGSINTLKNNSSISNLKYSSKDFKIGNCYAKSREGTFQSTGKYARFFYISFYHDNKAFFFNFINENNDKNTWNEIRKIIKTMVII